ncbi:hypothetical protein PoB_006925400 [Plakobranchus ocellatus]|uniref:Uncharacterized protein n=1 Tax=Plakobranchus ocellatus TaxID=259542 RepID=A0AAV4DF68_9GAST|nr:hypothetical protein PoB_006925400 [Plakobranchus ocellatus]
MRARFILHGLESRMHARLGTSTVVDGLQPDASDMVAAKYRYLLLVKDATSSKWRDRGSQILKPTPAFPSVMKGRMYRADTVDVTAVDASVSMSSTPPQNHPGDGVAGGSEIAL